MPGRTPIPAATQAKVQFESDRTCCVCRVPGKSIQIHHIDENNRNHDVTNLAVLCRDCHDQTMMKGTFNRRLDSDVVTLFRDDWLRIVAQKRATIEISEGNPSKENLSIALEKLEILKERGQYELLAVEYAQLGNESLRDKYIELALKHGVSDTTQIFLRSLQGKPEKISKACLNRVVRLQTSGEDWSQLARTYVDVRNYKKAIENYCKTVMRSLEENNVFSAAYYLQELCNRALHEQLFEETYTKYEREKNLWWALRSLDELGWESERRAFLLRHKKAIKKSKDVLLLKELYAVQGDTKSLEQLELQIAKSIESKPWGVVIAVEKKGTKKALLRCMHPH